MAQAAEQGEGADAAADEMSLGGRYVLAPSSPIPHLDSPGAKAVVARDLREPAREVYALIHKPGAPHRAGLAAGLLAEPIPNLGCPLFQDIAASGSKGEERLISVVNLPDGEGLTVRGTEGGTAGTVTRLGLDTVRRRLVPAAVKMLRALHGRSQTHRAVRPGTIFNGGEMTFGEAFSAPPGSGQPAAYEPLEEAMAESFGRSHGAPPADLYALGVTLLACHLGREPGSRLDTSALTAARIDKGSYYALTENADIPGALDPALRGLLADDPALRWTLSDLAAWADHGMVRQRAPVNSRHLSRPVRFNGSGYSDRCKLAAALGAKPLEAAAHLAAREPETWIAGAFPAKTTDERMIRLLDLGAAHNRAADQHTAFALTARLSAFIDPQGPIRYGEAALTPGGLGAALARAFAEKDEARIALLRDMFASRTLPACLEIRRRLGHGEDLLTFRVGDATRFASDRSAGAGLERALYVLSPETPCLSPLLVGQWASTPRRLMLALDAAAERGGPLARLLDRHVLAYLATHLESVRSYVAQTAAALAQDSEGSSAAPAILALLAFLQRKLALGPLYNLSARAADALAPSFQRLRSRTRRERAHRRLEAVAATGDLEQMRADLDPNALAAEDARGFAAARDRLRKLLLQRHHLNRPIAPEDREARTLGYSLAGGLGWLALLAMAGALTIERLV